MIEGGGGLLGRREVTGDDVKTLRCCIGPRECAMNNSRACHSQVYTAQFAPGVRQCGDCVRDETPGY